MQVVIIINKLVVWPKYKQRQVGLNDIIYYTINKTLNHDNFKHDPVNIKYEHSIGGLQISSCGAERVYLPLYSGR